MQDEIIVKRYTEAFLSSAKSSGLFERSLEDLRNLKNVVFRQNPELLEFLLSRQFTMLEKTSIIDKVLNSEFLNETRQFIKLLLEKERIDKLVDICEYARIKYAREGEIEALLRTAYPLDLSLIKRIKEKLEAKYHKGFKLYIDLDSSILGGIQVIFGNRIIDGSVQKKLEDLRAKLLTVRIS